MAQGMESNGRYQAEPAVAPRVEAFARPERQLIRRGGSQRHVDFQLKVLLIPPVQQADRMALSLGLVLDRSGSMSGEPLAMARKAALAVLDHLDERDQVALVVFDDQIDILQPLERAGPSLRARWRAQLERIEARASTALHEAWLTGCRTIAAATAADTTGRVTRCLLLTDGQANVGLTDPEQIASQAADIRRQTGIGTSTFGFGAFYAQELLGPLASAGGGQFHHLRSTEEIRRAVAQEVNGLAGVVASQVQLELRVEPEMTVDVVSAFWAEVDPEDSSRWSITIGELLRDEEERHVVVRVGFPAQSADDGGDGRTMSWRLTWMEAGVQRATSWQEVQFRYDTDRHCDAEVRDPAVMRWVGLQHADRAQREATSRNQLGDLDGARRAVRRVARRIAEYAGSDAELQVALDGLRELEQEVAAAPMPSMAAKEVYAESQRRSRGQVDRR